MRFAEVLATARPLADGFALAIPEDWHQGRTAYGGFSAALALSAAVRVGGAVLPSLRSAQISYAGPLYGKCEFRARELRRGRNATWIAVEASGEGGPGLTATFVFMGPVASALHLNQRPAPEGLIPVDEALPLSWGRGVNFLRAHFDVRFALSKSEARRPQMCWWVRLREREGIDATTGLVLCADALPPGVMPLVDSNAPVSTLTWLANTLTPTPATRDGWWLLRSSGDYAEQGCSSQQMEIWNTAGEPVMAGMQSVAVFG